MATRDEPGTPPRLVAGSTGAARPAGTAPGAGGDSDGLAGAEWGKVGEASRRAGGPATFQPRVEAEEGDPTRGDFVVGVLVVVLVVLGILWATGVLNFR